MTEVLNPSTAEEWSVAHVLFSIKYSVTIELLLSYANRKTAGNEFYKVKNYVSAISSYSKAIEMDPVNAMYYTNRAAAYLMSLQYKDAVSDCDQALRIDSACAKAYFRKASALKGIGQLDQVCIDWVVPLCLMRY
ncbi:tetratricopeptide repeat protein [archaeon]|nr:MAG: tetratricopeptide repeat protein [archaeon]